MKKKIFTSILSFVLCISCVWSVGCKGGENPPASSNGSNGSVGKEFEESGYNLVENGQSNYVIVLPEKPDKNLNFAATEITNFIKESSSVELRTVAESNVSGSMKYISLGDTEQSEKAAVSVDESYGETGNLIKTVDGNIYVKANTTYGVLFAAYDLLQYLIGLKVYAEDEFACEKKSVIPVYEFNEKFLPLIDSRHVSYRSVESSYMYRVRMGLHSIGEEWISWCHTTISVYLPTSKYAAEHPDWYNAMQDQLCYSNEEMRVEFVKQMKERIEKMPNGTYLMIGQEDNLNYCTCAKCMEYMTSHGGIDGGGFSALQLEFTNKCAEEVDAWLAQTHPDRKIKYVCFAYQTSETAPVNYDSATQKYVPNNTDIRVYKNVHVLFCPIYADFSLSMKDEANYSTYNNMVKWNNMLSACGAPENLMIYTYCIACKALFIPFPNFGMSADHYKTFDELGVRYVYDQNISVTALPSFEALKIYTQSMEMKYNDVDYNALTKDFIDHYYGEARVPMNKFYNRLRAWLLYLQKNKDYSGKIMFNTCQEEFWPIDVLLEFIDLIDEGFAAIEPLKSTDPERYQVLYDRLKREKLFPEWVMFYFYQGYMDYETQVEYINDLEIYTEKYTILQSAEGVGNVSSMIAGWKVAMGS